jgi:hypothetical protein
MTDLTLALRARRMWLRTDKELPRLVRRKTSPRCRDSIIAEDDEPTIDSRIAIENGESESLWTSGKKTHQET